GGGAIVQDWRKPGAGGGGRRWRPTLPPPRLDVDGKRDDERRSVARRALDADLPTERFDAILQADESGATAENRSADAVVADGQQQGPVARRERDVDARRLRRVGEGLRHDVVRDDLDPLGNLCVDRRVELDGDRRAARERLQRRTETTAGEDRRVDPTRDLLQLRERVGQPGLDSRQLEPELAHLLGYCGL